MKLDVTSEDGITTVRPHGKIDAMTSSSFQESMHEVLESGADRLIVDLSEVPFISSAGLRVFAVMAKQLKQSGKLIIAGMSDNISELFQLVGLDRLVSFCPDVAAARQELASRSTES